MIEVERHGEVVLLRLAHGRVNALDLDLCVALRKALTEQAGAGAVVLTGAGSCLSAGVDLKRLADGGRAYVEEFLPALNAAFLAVFDHPRPVVAAINGHAIAGGCVIAAGCDFRLMSGGTIGLTELAVGVPFPLVALEIVRYAAGPRAHEFVLGGGLYRPEQVTGFVEQVAPEELLDRAISRAEELARVPGATYRMTKEQLHRPVHAALAAYRDEDDRRVAELWRSDDALDGIRRYVGELGSRR